MSPTLFFARRDTLRYVVQSRRRCRTHERGEIRVGLFGIERAAFRRQSVHALDGGGDHIGMLLRTCDDLDEAVRARAFDIERGGGFENVLRLTRADDARESRRSKHQPEFQTGHAERRTEGAATRRLHAAIRSTPAPKLCSCASATVKHDELAMRFSNVSMRMKRSTRSPSLCVFAHVEARAEAAAFAPAA